MTIIESGFDPVHNPVLALAVSPGYDTDGICFAGTRSGLLRSAIGGTTWQSATTGDVPITVVACSPDFAKNRLVLAGSVGGVLHSADGGATWQHVAFGSPPPVVSCILWLTPNIVLAGTVEDGIFRSDDAGMSWKPANTGVLDYRVQALAVPDHLSETGLVFAATSSGLLVSRSGGRSWLELPFPAGVPDIDFLAVCSTPGEESLLLIGNAAGALNLSVDDGTSWESLNLPAGHNEQLIDLSITPTGQIVICREREVRMSSDRGGSWQSLFRTTDPMVAVTLINTRDPAAGVLAIFADGRCDRIKPGD